MNNNSIIDNTNLIPFSAYSGQTEILKVTSDGKFIWDENAGELLKNAPPNAINHLLDRLYNQERLLPELLETLEDVLDEWQYGTNHITNENNYNPAYQKAVELIGRLKEAK